MMGTAAGLVGLAVQQYPEYGEGGGSGLFAGAFFVIWLGIFILMAAASWKIFTKAGKPGWAALIPIYNLIVLLEITGKPLWWFILFLVPFANLVALVLLAVALAQKFGKGVGFAIGLLLLPMVFFPILAFGPARYQG